MNELRGVLLIAGCVPVIVGALLGVACLGRAASNAVEATSFVVVLALFVAGCYFIFS